MSGTRRKPGRMGPHIVGFRESLLAAGYTPATVRGLLMVMGQLGRWMDVADVGPERLTVDDLDAFGRSLRTRPDRRVPRLRSIDPLVVYLRDGGVLEMHEPSPATAVSELLDVYRSWLTGERDLPRQRCCATRTPPAGSWRNASSALVIGSSSTSPRPT
jgi:hypothetical protein